MERKIQKQKLGLYSYAQVHAIVQQAIIPNYIEERRKCGIVVSDRSVLGTVKVKHQAIWISRSVAKNTSREETGSDPGPGASCGSLLYREGVWMAAKVRWGSEVRSSKGGRSV